MNRKYAPLFIVPEGYYHDLAERVITDKEAAVKITKYLTDNSIKLEDFTIINHKHFNNYDQANLFYYNNQVLILNRTHCDGCIPPVYCTVKKMLPCNYFKKNICTYYIPFDYDYFKSSLVFKEYPSPYMCLYVRRQHAQTRSDIKYIDIEGKDNLEVLNIAPNMLNEIFIKPITNTILDYISKNYIVYLFDLSSEIEKMKLEFGIRPSSDPKKGILYCWHASSNTTVYFINNKGKGVRRKISTNEFYIINEYLYPAEWE